MKNDADVCPYLPTNDFHLTFIDERPLLSRLVAGLCWASVELKRAGVEFQKAPIRFVRTSAATLGHQLISSDRWFGVCTAVVLLLVLGLSVRFFERRVYPRIPDSNLPDKHELSVEILSLENPTLERGNGVNGVGRVGINRDRGEGSNAIKQRAGGGGSGGNHNPLPPLVGQVPPPSPVKAVIQKPPLNPSLPVAGVDLDPNLWRDLKMPEYGEPRSKSELASNGPGEGEGIGTRQGTGIGDGSGSGFGSGNHGNTGGGENQRGCCGPGASTGNSEGWNNRVWRGNEVEQRARLLSKPEPQYTEEARRNQIVGTVVLRVVFSSSGEVTQIHAVQPLPFGLTERAIAAARQIRFLPATKAGHAVSVWMQLEYNFNLY